MSLLDMNTPALFRQNAFRDAEDLNKSSLLSTVRFEILSNWKCEWGKNEKLEVMTNSNISLNRLKIIINNDASISFFPSNSL